MLNSAYSTTYVPSFLSFPFCLILRCVMKHVKCPSVALWDMYMLFVDNK